MYTHPHPYTYRYSYSPHWVRGLPLRPLLITEEADVIYLYIYIQEQVKQPLKKTIGRKFGHNFNILVWLFLPFLCVYIYIYIYFSLSPENEVCYVMSLPLLKIIPTQDSHNNCLLLPRRSS